ncbi:MAG: lipoyl synthase [Limnochordaceae bacterium]|nr:lipoyl synthase [Limnochordaceae bacterium]
MPSKPRWLVRPLPEPQALARIHHLVDRLSLRTVCVDAGCPNVGLCWGQGTATFMILGENCTRRCGFCKVKTGRPEPVDPLEPLRVAEAVAALNLRHAVITSVTRDDLPDGGAAQFAATIRAIRERLPGTTVEVLIPDFKGDIQALRTVLAAKPEVLAHNVETVPRLQRRVRPQARFERSVGVLKQAKEIAPASWTKSGMMLGLGETPEEVKETLRRVREEAQVDFFTIGQYLQPSREHLPVERFVPPEEFEEYRQYGLSLGYRYVAAGPFVRSSFDAAAALQAVGAAAVPANPEVPGDGSRAANDNGAI